MYKNESSASIKKRCSSNSQSVSPNYEPHILRDISKPYIFHFGNMSVLPHWHENIELLYFHGKSKVICGRDEHEVDDGDVAIFGTNKIHSVHSLGGAHDCLIVDDSFLKRNDIDTSELKFDVVIKNADISEKFRVVTREVKCNCADVNFGAAAMKSAILSLMVAVCRGFTTSVEKSSGRSEIINNAIGYIKAHYGESLTVNLVAESVNVSKYYFCREFRRETGYTIIQYINNLRCREAEKLLCCGKYSVSEVARMCGFKNMSYFTRTYKNIVGHTPIKSKLGIKDV